MNELTSLSSPRSALSSLEPLFAVVALSDERTALSRARAVRASGETALSATRFPQEMTNRMVELSQRSQVLSERIIVAESNCRKAELTWKGEERALELQLTAVRRSLATANRECESLRSRRMADEKALEDWNLRLSKSERAQPQLTTQLASEKGRKITFTQLMTNLGAQIEEREEIRVLRDAAAEIKRWIKWEAASLKEAYKGVCWFQNRADIIGFMVVYAYAQDRTKTLGEACSFFAAIRDDLDRAANSGEAQALLKQCLQTLENRKHALKVDLLVNPKNHLNTPSYISPFYDLEQQTYRVNRMLERLEEGILAARDEALGWAEFAPLEMGSFKELGEGYRCDIPTAKGFFAVHSTMVEESQVRLESLRNYFVEKKPRLQEAYTEVERALALGKACVEALPVPSITTSIYNHALKRVLNHMQIGIGISVRNKQELQRRIIL